MLRILDVYPGSQFFSNPDPGSKRFPEPDLDFLPITDRGVKRHRITNPGSGSVTLVVGDKPVLYRVPPQLNRLADRLAQITNNIKSSLERLDHFYSGGL